MTINSRHTIGDQPSRLSISTIDNQIMIFGETTQTAIAVLPVNQAIGLASGPAHHTALTVNDQAPDLAGHLRRTAQQLHAALAAFDTDLYPSTAAWHLDPYADRPYPAVPDHVSAVCDNASVGVIITDPDGRLLMLERVRPPAGVAPAAGHLDDHGSPEDAARAEVTEELGLTVTALTRITSRWRTNICRRQHGPHGPGHQWTIYHAQVTGTINPAADEARNVAWYTPAQLQTLTDRTIAHAHGHLSVADYTTNPGLEPVWVEFLTETGYIHATPTDLAAVNRLASTSPYPQREANG